jgi:RNA polymerase sigma-70 factor (ECF subfamily)
MTAIASEVVPVPALSRARAGDHDAFADLVSDHEAMVFSIAYHVFNDRSRAEELAQDVFLQLFRSLSAIDSPSHLVHWLRQVTTRRCIDQLRRNRVRPVSLEEAHEIPTHDKPADPLLGRRLRELIAQLPDLQRVIVTLRYQEDLQPSEISGILEMPVNTVKSHLHRAIVSLRMRLGEA